MFVGLKLRHVQDMERVLRSQVGRLVAEEVPLAEAPAMWQAFDGIERLATAAKTLLAERVEESRVWARAGDRSAAEYLARTSGSSVGVARSGFDTAKRLRRLPATEAAARCPVAGPDRGHRGRCGGESRRRGIAARDS